MIQNTRENFDSELANLEKTVYLYTNNPENYGLNEKEAGKRVKKVEQMKETFQKIVS